MNLKFRIINNIFKQGFQGMWRNRGMGVASVTSISAVLMILGIILIMILSINNFVADTTTKFDEITVFLEDDIDDGTMTKIEDKIKGNEGIVSIIFESKDQALDKFKQDWGDEAYLLDGLERNNPLPNSYVVKVEEIVYAENLVSSLTGLDGVEKVKYDKDVIDKLMLVADYIRVGGIIVIAILVFVSIFLISNTIKLTVTSRRREINIMKYVGATNNYIRGPFVMEGILFGLLGAIVSIVIVYYGYEYFFDVVNERLYSLFSVFLLAPTMIFTDIVIIFSAIGIGIGALGSIVSMKRFLNV
ncbi:permease-like cell division protein FtsX [Tissierella sp. Yu-01]|uniref:permease-like cell division protein FtsX n=1 Tax=Tissierella sp. Yu-01 TaxID=3035694 RepID=UPI00240D972A|nr:permease-like cell division protein FtsX [Tissierella sp. Yu-01]WFA09143.1 permease-like cell division protein FtsX [Tissierella sp. Yu-01]